MSCTLTHIISVNTQRTIDQTNVEADALSTADLEAFSRRFIYLRNFNMSPLLRLPAEVRNQIWELVLIDDLQDQQQHWAAEVQEIRNGDRHKQIMYGLGNVSSSHLRTLAAVQYRMDWLHKLRFWPRLPIMFSVCRQLKHEAVSVFFAKVMVLIELVVPDDVDRV